MPDRPGPGPGSTSSLKEANRQRLVRAVQDAGSLTQAELAQATGLAPSTVSSIVHELSHAGVLAVSPTRRNGRRAQAVGMAASAGVVVGADFGHRHLTVAIGDMTCSVLAEQRVDLSPGHRAADGLDKAAELADQLLDRAGFGWQTVVGVGVGLPAPIDSRTRLVGAPSILPGWVGVDAARLATERLGKPAFVDNDANLGALAEASWGAGRGAENVTYLKLSDGVGAGLIIGGQLFRGRVGTAGEIGHTTLQEFGEVCRCGNRGCLETLVSTEAFLRLLRPTISGRSELTVAEAVELARSGNPGCRRVLADTGRYVGIALANLCNLANPDRIVIGGELAQAGDLLVNPIRMTLDRYGIPSAVRDVEIVTAALGERSHLLGALAQPLRLGNTLSS